jgi:hypothetical protein
LTWIALSWIALSGLALSRIALAGIALSGIALARIALTGIALARIALARIAPLSGVAAGSQIISHLVSFQPEGWHSCASREANCLESASFQFDLKQSRPEERGGDLLVKLGTKLIATEKSS